MLDKILVIDDEPNLLKILSALLTRKGYEVFAFAGFDEAVNTLNTEDLSVVVTDLSMPGKSGMDVLNYCKQYTPDLPVIMITAFGTIEAAVAALKADAFDFVLKPFEQDDLFNTIEKAIQSRRRRRREPALDFVSAVGIGPLPVPLFGFQTETILLNQDVNRIAGTRSNVLMMGEIGTGKRSVAYEIHRKSEFARGPFSQLHCEAVPEAFQISELFGAEKGVTPVAFVSRPGKMELTLNGTLILEEVTALSVSAQNALFTALENESFTRLGGVKIYPTDLRIIATTSKPIEELVRTNKFHSELYQKLSVETLLLSPLKDRMQDLETHLLPYFVERSCKKKGVPTKIISPEAMNWFKQQSWPGNLGELEKTVEKLVNQCSDPNVTLPSGWC